MAAEDITKLNVALSGVRLMRAMFMLQLLKMLLKMHLRGSARVITAALSLASFHFSSLSDHTEKGNCLGKSVSPQACG